MARNPGKTPICIEPAISPIAGNLLRQVRVRFEQKETAAAILTWAKENGIVLVDDREKLPIASRVYSKAARDRQDREASTVLRRESAVPPCPWCLWHVRFQLRHPGNRSPRPTALCYPKCHCRRTYSGKGDSAYLNLRSYEEFEAEPRDITAEVLVVFRHFPPPCLSKSRLSGQIYCCSPRR
jgi:hypothetical protein